MPGVFRSLPGSSAGAAQFGERPHTWSSFRLPPCVVSALSAPHSGDHLIVDPDVVLEKAVGFACKYCGSGRLRRSGAIKHAASRKHRAKASRLGQGHGAVSAPALAKYSFPTSTDEQRVDSTELGSEQGMWEQDTYPTPGRAIGSFRPPENDPAVILAAMGIPATPHVVQAAQVSGFVDYVETIQADTHVRFSGYRSLARQGLLEDPDMKERPGLLRYHITHARMIEVLLEEMTMLKEAVLELSATDLKINQASRKKIQK
ncbi:BZ3500_MvSof-1268-A1-R1_Chr6-2g08431 [Microbotryum saponariae]|uniref:BZ3500_MvSof-1268-A1-R1_Chr6-2g08431 protein n=1 Tax=Microbotryum saponariae TaxID=289078 RepID=A0A2X0LQJ5_9BASI|nr:BZ3500_MvSof-1268-A1-R1_Chr6-2g08431 [Microbotryum saponariae]SDA07708.1 BZ3501_MvSof-1269-A2-R1_Chr6-1g08145 [Microbotryum saponariae]